MMTFPSRKIDEHEKSWVKAPATLSIQINLMIWNKMVNFLKLPWIIVNHLALHIVQNYLYICIFVPWSTLICLEMPSVSFNCKKLPWITMHYLEEPWRTLNCHELPWNTLNYLEVPRITIIYHYLPWNTFAYL